MDAKAEIFDPGDHTALVCIDDPELQKTVIDQITALNYGCHAGLFIEDISLKLSTHVYDVVVIYETFNESDLETNQVLAEAMAIPASQRRLQYLVLVGPNMVTNDDMMAFACSVDLTFCLSDISNLKPVLRRGVVRHKEFYHPFCEALRAAEAG